VDDLVEMVDGLVAAVSVAPAGNDRFVADEPEWFGTRVFGGMIVAQALNAAVRTVADGRPPHSLHGYFLRPANAGVPALLTVERVRDGRAFASRAVTMTQDGAEIFRAMCSFHGDEDGEEYQLPIPPGSTPPDAFPAPDDDFEGPFESRDAGAARRADGSYESTRRMWFRMRAPLPPDPTLHATLLAYLSDMTGTGFRPHNLGEWGTHTDASIDHAVWFHRPARLDDWLLFDVQALVNAGARSTVRGSIYSQDGVLRASMAQELLIRRLDVPGNG
jgi:acyl-CoA thioesterase-2